MLTAPVDVDDYAHVLYARLRESDARDVDELLVIMPPADGIGAAVADRIGRAAS